MEHTAQARPAEGFVFSINSLYAALQHLSDSRKKKGMRYALLDLLVLMVLAKLGGADTPSGIADWVQARRAAFVELLALPHRSVPHHSTYWRILADVIDADEFEHIAGNFHQAQLPTHCTGAERHLARLYVWAGCGWWRKRDVQHLPLRVAVRVDPQFAGPGRPGIRVRKAQLQAWGQFARAPFNLSGVPMFTDLQAIQSTLEQCLQRAENPHLRQ